MNKDFKEFISKYTKLLPIGGLAISPVEAERRAGEFLAALATVTEFKHSFTTEKIKSQSVQSAVYAEELAKGTAKTVTENKVFVEASEPYTRAREDYESLDNDISYLKAYYEIFNNAHIFYRNLAKDNYT